MLAGRLERLPDRGARLLLRIGPGMKRSKTAKKIKYYKGPVWTSKGWIDPDIKRYHRITRTGSKFKVVMKSGPIINEV